MLLICPARAPGSPSRDRGHLSVDHSFKRLASSWLVGVADSDSIVGQSPSSQFRLVRSHVAARAVLELAGAREMVLAEIGDAASTLVVPPASVIVFGSFARDDAGPQSDVDAVFVRPEGVGEDDARWADGVEHWRTTVRTLTGNSAEVLEVPIVEIAARLQGRQAVWHDIRRDGRVVHGLTLDELEGAAHA